MNVVYILSDRHNPEFSGCYGNSITRTPNMDQLAEAGTRFESAYCVSPLCAATRAAMMSGRYVHEIGAWDNTSAYTGVPKGWGHFFREKGVLLTTIGKLDFRPDGDHGIEDERMPSHRENLDVMALFREDPVLPRVQYLHRLRDAGPSDSLRGHSRDFRAADEAVRWLKADRPSERPWVLVVNFSNLHKWTPPRDLWDHYDPLIRSENLDERYTEDLEHLHPFHKAFARYSNAEYIQPEEVRRGVVGYHASVEILDGHIGRVLDALEETGIREETLVVYGADHSGNCGEHRIEDHGGLYEESIRVPLLFSGPGGQTGQVVRDPVSMLDVFPTICEAVGLESAQHMRGVSLLDLIQGNSGAQIPAFTLSEYHADGFPGSGFALRSGPWKYVECVGERPMLFHLADDPYEMHDLVVQDDPGVQDTLIKLRTMLCKICSPEAVDARAKADQRALRDRLAKSGRLDRELKRRGFMLTSEGLQHTDAFLP
ncbi:MAG: sulfatase-like hydrolase/transferase [bacterium]|nr:sulfatase-like hydrolase/transferase [bacterium]